MQFIIFSYFYKDRTVISLRIKSMLQKQFKKNRKLILKIVILSFISTIPLHENKKSSNRRFFTLDNILFLMNIIRCAEIHLYYHSPILFLYLNSRSCRRRYNLQL